MCIHWEPIRNDVIYNESKVFCFAFKRPSRALRDASWGHLGAFEAASSRGNAPKSDLGAKNDASEASGTFKIIVFQWENYSFAKNTLFNSKLAKELPNASWEALREPMEEPRAPRGACKRSIFRAKRPPRGTP